MENNEIFVRTLLTDKVKLRPNQLSVRIKDHIVTLLKSKYEGVCSHHGYIRQNSVEIFKCSMGHIQPLSLNGDVEYFINYHADVCNPSIGSIIRTKVVNTNKFGLLTHTGVKDSQGKFLPILEIIIAKHMINTKNDQNIDDIGIGYELHVELIGKKFDLGSKKICGIGRIIENEPDRNILDEERIANKDDEVEDDIVTTEEEE